MRKVTGLLVMVILLLLASSAFALLLPDPVVLVYKGKDKMMGFEDFGTIEAYKGTDTTYFIVEIDGNTGDVSDFQAIFLWKDTNGNQGDIVPFFNFVAAYDAVSSKPSASLYSFDPFNDSVNIGSVLLQGPLVQVQFGKGTYPVAKALSGRAVFNTIDPDGPGYAVTAEDFNTKLDTKMTQTANSLGETAAQTVLRIQGELTEKLKVNW